MSASQCDRVLAVLKDGRPHTMEEIHQFAGFMRLNSRVSDLRKRGHTITCDKAGGVYTYQLHADTLNEPAIPAGGLDAVGAVSLHAGSLSVPTPAPLPLAEPSLNQPPPVEPGGTLHLFDIPVRSGAYGNEAA